MKNFREITEKSGDTAVFTFGRFNPPTSGHEKVVNAVAAQQKKNSGSKMYVYASHSNDPKRNPLSHSKKVAYMRKMLPKYKRNIVASKARNIFEIATELHDKGHRAIVMVVGSDRVTEFDELLNTYNGVEGRHGYYGFDNIEVISAGERDPDAEGITGMSATKMRDEAEGGNFDSFKTGIPDTMSDADKKKMYFDVRKGMGIREERDMGKMDTYETMRDNYLTGKIWNVGEPVIVDNLVGEVVRKGTNYLSYMTKDGKVHKAWLHEITNTLYEGNPAWDKAMAGGAKAAKAAGLPDEEEPKKAEDKILKASKTIPLQKLKRFDQLRTAIGKKPIFKDKKKDKKKKEEVEVELDERNYKKEYANYHSKPEQIARRSSRNKARRVMGDRTKIGMDVGHRDNNPLNNDPANLRNEDPSENRREPRLREEKVPNDELNWIKTGGMVGKKRRFPTYIVKKEGNKYKAYDEQNKMSFIAASNSLEGLAKLLKPYIEKRTGSWKFEEVELDELSSPLPWLDRAAAKVSQITQSKSWEIMLKKYVNGMKDKDHQKHPGAWAGEIARQYSGINGRDLVKYINKLVDNGKLPKQLRADYDPLEEVLSKNASQQEYIDDFISSDAPQFKGKSKDKRIAMAIAAYNSKNDK